MFVSGDEHLLTYRLYLLDRHGKIASAEWIEADDDASAVAAARALGRPTECELWLRNRLIERIAATPAE